MCTVYSGLYTSGSTNEEMQVLQETVKSLITPEIVSEVTRVTGVLQSNCTLLYMMHF